MRGLFLPRDQKRLPGKRRNAPFATVAHEFIYAAKAVYEALELGMYYQSRCKQVDGVHHRVSNAEVKMTALEGEIAELRSELESAQLKEADEKALAKKNHEAFVAQCKENVKLKGHLSTVRIQLKGLEKELGAKLGQIDSLMKCREALETQLASASVTAVEAYKASDQFTADMASAVEAYRNSPGYVAQLSLAVTKFKSSSEYKAVQAEAIEKFRASAEFIKLLGDREVDGWLLARACACEAYPDLDWNAVDSIYNAQFN